MSAVASRVAVVYNPTKVSGERLRRHALDRAARHGWTDPVFYETTADDPGSGQAERAVSQGVGLVIACGGDGTVRAVARGLIGRSVPMGIVPMGTGNLLARNLDLPLEDLDGALRVAMSGRVRPIDVGTVEYTDDADDSHSDVFLVMLGAGMDADMIAGTDAQLKARVGWLAYVGAFASTLLRGHRIKLDFTVDGSPAVQTKARMLLVANCGMLQAGMVLLPDAVIDDGKLDVMTLRAKGAVGWVHAGAVLAHHTVRHYVNSSLGGSVGSTESGGRRQPVDFRQGSRISATLPERPAAFQIDGEDCGSITAFSASITPRGLTVRVPH